MRIDGKTKIRVKTTQHMGGAETTEDSKGLSAKTGDIREWGDGTKHIKTAKGWKFYSGATGKVNPKVRKVKVRHQAEKK